MEPKRIVLDSGLRNPFAMLMLLVDVLVRYSAIAFLLFITVIALRDGKKLAPARYAALVTISVAAMLLSTAPAELSLPRIPYIIVHLMDTPNIVFVWWLGLSMFQSEFKLSLVHWAMFILYTGLVFVYRLIDFGFDIAPPSGFDLLVDIVTFAMIFHLAFITLKDRPDDLVAPRRRLRVFFVMALVLGTALTVIAENLFIENFGPGVTLFRAIIALCITIWALLWLTKFLPEKISFQAIQPAPAQQQNFDPRDAPLQKLLIGKMEEEKIYLQPELTIRTLAARLKAPEHRLRALINQGLGYQNFSAFLNAYRIKEVKQAFSHPDNARIPVLTIAMDAGYASLAPFNRAFLKAENMTPSAYRQNLLKKSDRK